MADKTEAIRRMERAGLPIPATLRVCADNLSALDAFCDVHPDVSHWYLRYDETKVVGAFRVVATENLRRVVTTALNACPDLAFIVHERVTPMISGVTAVTTDALFIEYITGGELFGLLRAAVSPSRVLLTRAGITLCQELNEEEFSFRWQGERLVLDQSEKHRTRMFPEALKEIGRAHV